MTLEEGKKLVVEKLMGWEIISIPDILLDGTKYYEYWIQETDYTPPNPLRDRLEYWNPQSERKWWDEIWDKMEENLTEHQWGYYECEIDILMAKHMRKNQTHLMFYHTAKPKISWEALIKTIEWMRRTKK